jgi:hypothetical protein
VILHTLVDVEVGAGRRIEACEELIDDDQQLHVGGLFFEFVLGVEFIGFGFGLLGSGHDVLGDFGVEVVDELLIGFGVGSGVFGGDVFGLGIVGGNDGTFAFEWGLLEAFVVFAGFVDAGDDEHGVAPIVVQAGFGAEVEGDVFDDPIDAGAGAEDFLHGAPFFPQGGSLPVVESFGFGIKPGVDFGFGAEGLVDVAGFVD